MSKEKKEGGETREGKVMAASRIEGRSATWVGGKRLEGRLIERSFRGKGRNTGRAGMGASGRP